MSRALPGAMRTAATGLALLALACLAQACSAEAGEPPTGSTDATSAPGGSAGKGGSGGAAGNNGGKGGASGIGGASGTGGGFYCDALACKNGVLLSVACPGEAIEICAGSSVQCVPKGQSCPGTGGTGGTGGTAGTGGAGTGGGSGGSGLGGSGGSAGACADVKAGGACDAAAPDCDLSDGLVASCVKGAWWVGVLAGPASDATPCSPYGTWALAYGPASGPTCGTSKPETLEIRPVHDGTKRAVRFGTGTKASMPVDGCSVTASSTVSFSGMGETGSSTVSVSVSFKEPVSGAFALSGTGFCGGENATGELTVTKK